MARAPSQSDAEGAHFGRHHDVDDQPPRRRELPSPAGPFQDRIDHWLFRLGVVVDVSPLPIGQRPLGGLVQVPVGLVSTKTITEHQVLSSLRVVGRVAVQVDRLIRLTDAQAAMLRLPNSQVVAGGFEIRQIGGLVVRVVDADDDVDDRLGGEPRDRCRADLLDQTCPVTENAAELDGPCFEPSWRRCGSYSASWTRTGRGPRTRSRASVSSVSALSDTVRPLTRCAAGYR